MPEINVEIWCNQCGKGLCHLSSTHGTSIHIDPCPDCLEKANMDGYREGYDDGYDERRNEEI